MVQVASARITAQALPSGLADHLVDAPFGAGPGSAMASASASSPGLFSLYLGLPLLLIGLGVLLAVFLAIGWRLALCQAAKLLPQPACRDDANTSNQARSHA
ncbi:unnamed protein product, partial [Protopolystoma xenopodis]